MGPSIESFQAIVTHQGLELSEARVADAVEGHRSIAEGLLALRTVPLSFLEPVPEPSAAISWIERGATS